MDSSSGIDNVKQSNINPIQTFQNIFILLPYKEIFPLVIMSYLFTSSLYVLIMSNYTDRIYYM